MGILLEYLHHQQKQEPIEESIIGGIGLAIGAALTGFAYYSDSIRKFIDSNEVYYIKNLTTNRKSGKIQGKSLIKNLADFIMSDYKIIKCNDDGKVQGKLVIQDNNKNYKYELFLDHISLGEFDIYSLAKKINQRHQREQGLFIVNYTTDPDKLRKVAKDVYQKLDEFIKHHRSNNVVKYLKLDFEYIYAYNRHSIKTNSITLAIYDPKTDDKAKKDLNKLISYLNTVVDKKYIVKYNDIIDDDTVEYGEIIVKPKSSVKENCLFFI